MLYFIISTIITAPLEGVTNILLFAPEFAYCKAEGKDGPVEVGNTMHGYSVYNVRRFVRGRLGTAASKESEK